MRDNSSHDRPPARFITAPELGSGMSAEGLDAIFSPRSIAVIGASRHRGKIGYEILRNLIVNEYQGILYPVNPNATGIHGIRAYPRIPDVRMDAAFAPTPPLRGGISLVTQSGALGIAILEHARTLGVGFAKFCSLGNKAQVSLNDLLASWRADPETKIVLAYIENFGNPKNFVRIARATTKEKPVIAVKSGRSEAGSRAAASHTGSLGG